MRSRSLLALLLVVGCGDKSPPPVTGGGDTATATEVPDDTGETSAEPVVFSEVSVVLSESISAVAIVTFSAEGGSGDGWVRFNRSGATGGLDVAAAPQEDGSWRAVLVGIPPETDAWLQVGRGTTLDAEVHTYTTGAPPEWITVTAEGASESEGFVLTALMGQAGRSGAVIFTAAGEPVWWYPVPPEAGGILSRARLSADRRSLWFNSFNIEPASASRDAGRLIRVALDGSEREIVEVHKKSHHDFFLRDDGTFVLPRLDDRAYEGGTLRGDALVEIDPETGDETILWSSWDDLTPATDGHPEGWWTMLNHLVWDAAEDDYVFSMKNISTVARLDRATGTLEWVLGGKDATLATDTVFRGQHGLDVADDGDILVFDNQGSGRFSRVLRYEIDATAQEAEVVWEHEGEVTSLIMGDVQTLDNGNVRIHWSSACQMEELRPDGTVVSHVELPGLTNVGYITWEDTIGPVPAL